MLDLLLIVLMQAAVGDPQTPPPEPATEERPSVAVEHPEPQARDRVRCQYQRLTGSRVATRVCMSEAEEELVRNETQRELNRTIRRTGVNALTPE